MGSDAPQWVADAVFYEIFPDRFANGDPGNDPVGTLPWGTPPTRDNFLGGDLQGIMDHLDYLEELGINAVYLTPIFKAQTNHKYDASDYFAIDPAFGTTELLRSLVKTAHRRDIRIILDGVFNHCGSSFWAFEDVKARGPLSPYTDWFYISSFPMSQDPPNYQTCGATGYLPKLNLENPAAKNHILRAATYWIEECDIDGWRLDVPWKVSYDFWREFRERVKGAKSDSYLVSEAWREPRPWSQGEMSDGIMNYPLRDIMLAYTAKHGIDAEDFEYETRVLREGIGPAAIYQMNLLGSHDTPRLLTLFNGDVERTILAYTLIFTFVGAPMIYYGDEIGMTGGPDPDCRKCMVWDEASWNMRIYEACRLLIRARKEHPALRFGNLVSLWTFNNVFAYLRQYNEDRVIVVVNPGDLNYHLTIPFNRVAAENILWSELYTGKQFRQQDDYIHIDKMPSCTAYVLTPEE
jgi:cyclomaltodextrinase